jgi:hypothetical protein
MRKNKTRALRILFSDETWITTNEKTGSHQWAKTSSKVLPFEKKAKWNVASFQIFAVVGVGYKSPLVCLPVNRVDEDGETRAFRLDGGRYIRHCLSRVVGTFPPNRVFMQDGARAHTCVRTQRYLERKGIETIAWPPYSSDLNPIENIWSQLKTLIGQRCPLTMVELKTAALEAWDELPQAAVDKTVRHFLTSCEGYAL